MESWTNCTMLSILSEERQDRELARYEHYRRIGLDDLDLANLARADNEVGVRAWLATRLIAAARLIDRHNVEQVLREPRLSRV